MVSGREGLRRQARLSHIVYSPLCIVMSNHNLFSALRAAFPADLNAVAVTVFEAWRQNGFGGATRPAVQA